MMPPIVGIDWIGARNGEHAFAIRHNNVFALPDNAKTGLFERANCFEVRNSREFAHCYTLTSTCRTPGSPNNSSRAARYS